MTTTTITDHKWKFFRTIHEVPTNILVDYDYLTPDERFDNWILYRRHWSHLSDYTGSTFMGETDPSPPYQAYCTVVWRCFYFSAQAINISDDGESYQIALILS